MWGSGQRSNGTGMRMLIEEQMGKETERDLAAILVWREYRRRC
jgi:hypothetical protein